MSSFFESIFGGPKEPVAEAPVAEAPVAPARNSNSSLPPTRVLTPITTTIEKFRTKNAGVTKQPSSVPTTSPLSRRLAPNNQVPPAQSVGRRVRSKSKSLRPSLFRKYKYKMARRSMTMRKGRKGRKGSRRARR